MAVRALGSTGKKKERLKEIPIQYRDRNIRRDNGGAPSGRSAVLFLRGSGSTRPSDRAVSCGTHVDEWKSRSGHTIRRACCVPECTPGCRVLSATPAVGGLQSYPRLSAAVAAAAVGTGDRWTEFPRRRCSVRRHRRGRRSIST